MITVWGRATSSNVQAVMWTLAELGREVERIDAGGEHGGTDTAEFRAMNPNGLIPVLRDRGLVMFESAAIVRYLAAAYGDEAFWPRDPRKRAALDVWAEWARGEVARTFTHEIFWQLIRIGPEDCDRTTVERGTRAMARKMAIAEERLDSDYLGGETLSWADIWLGNVLYRYFDLEFERAETPRLRAYYERLTERPAYARHVMVSYDSLRGAAPGER